MLKESIKKVKDSFLNKQPQILFLLWLIVILFLVKQTGYFAPYLELTFLLIAFVIWSLAIILLRFNSKVSLIAATIMWFVSMNLVWVGIVPWAERAALYSFGFLALFTLQFFFEVLGERVVNK